MRLVIASQGNDMFSVVDQDFGSARYLLLVNTDIGQITAYISNDQAGNAQGDDAQVAKNVLTLGGEAVISGDISPEAAVILQLADTDVYAGAKGTVAQAVEQYKLDQLQRVGGTKVKAH